MRNGGQSAGVSHGCRPPEPCPLQEACQVGFRQIGSLRFLKFRALENLSTAACARAKTERPQFRDVQRGHGPKKKLPGLSKLVRGTVEGRLPTAFLLFCLERPRRSWESPWTSPFKSPTGRRGLVPEVTFLIHYASTHKPQRSL